jgi:hypothetical protein
MSLLICDIETGPLPDDVLRDFLPPFEAPPHPGEFDSASVKYGNTKDEAKRAAKLEECRAAHNQAVAEYAITVEQARANHWEQFKEKAALSPITGCVVAIGYLNQAKEVAGIDGVGEPDGNGGEFDEAAILTKFWNTYHACKAKNLVIAGWNFTGFDVPFIVRRSWFHGIDTPSDLFDRSGRYLTPTFMDLMQRFSVGKWNDNMKLDVAARFFRVGQKNGEGKDFARLWLAGGEERESARAYLANDLWMTGEVARRMGVG